MNNTESRSSDRVIEYVETMIMAGRLKEDDHLPAERDLAKMLNVSRTAVREGIRLLEISGIVECRQGSGNYITPHFDRTLEQILTMMYALEELDQTQIREFRYAVERQALTLAVNNSNENDRLALKKYLDGFLNGLSEEEQIENDRLLHLQLVRMSGNRLVIANYTALTRIIDRSIRDMRRKIHTESPMRFGQYQDVHRNLAEAVLAGDLEHAKRALDEHFSFLADNYDT